MSQRKFTRENRKKFRSIRIKTQHNNICGMQLKQNFTKKFIQLYAYITKEKGIQINDLSFHPKKLEKEELIHAKPPEKRKY